jgi:crossover junction endodeoxyribonuclease RuvC
METAVKILGIDPGLRVCGYGCIEQIGTATKLLEAGVVRTKTSETMEYRLNQIAVDIAELLVRLKPSIVAVEELYSHYAHPRTSILMGHARGVILQQCAAAEIEVRSFAATKIKKSLTGNGRASKEMMQRTIQSMLHLDNVPEPNDVADAIAAALCYVDSKRMVL